MKKTGIPLVLILILAVVLLAGCNHTPSAPVSAETAPPVTEAPTLPEAEVPTDPSTESATEPEPTEPPFTAESTPSSDPANWNVAWEIIEKGEIVDSYTREEPIFFEDAPYCDLPGVSTFRGSNYRTDASYGTVDISEFQIGRLWKMNVGYLDTANWGGCCWTGQPLAVEWDEETKAIMNLYDEKKEKEGLVEVIYGKADGYIHFIDMEDGSYTRDPLYIGMAFKGAGTVDPRGYPILYIGAGLARFTHPKMYAISLIDGSILYERGCDDEFAPRVWYGMDGAPLVDAETDTLIWGGESGLLYTIKLNTQYDKAAGTLTMAPEEPVMSRYRDDYTESGRNAGYESSITAVENYLYVGDNSGMFFCIDVNTMELVWAQDMVDDVNATPVFDWGADGNGYLYIAPSMDYAGFYGVELPICKLDARTGEVLWTHTMVCGTQSGVPGGVLASPVLGRAGSNMEDLIIFCVGCSPTVQEGQVVALDKESGEVVWQYETKHYMWSSPVALYTEDNRGYLFLADSRGNCYLLDGATGEELCIIDLDSTVEASPVAFDNHIILGTRSRIYLLEVT